MRYKVWKKYLKIACSWILIFSICFLSLNTVSASEEDTFISEEGTYENSADEDQDQQPDDIVSDGEESDQEPEEQEPEDQIPDSLKVEVLDAEIKKELANGEEPYTDCVEYVDETGNPIDGAPVTISLGKIEDHISLFGTDKNYEFKSAKVDGADIVFIGKYKDNLYYSTDGIDADRMEDRQKLVMTYAEIKDAQDNEDNSPDQTPEETPDQTPEETPDQTPEGTPDQTPEETPDQTPEETPDQTPEETPDQTPEETPDQTPEETPDQTPDTEEPGQMSVQELEEELQKDLANGEEPFTDRVEYIDETGNLIDGAPETICLGRIKDHVSLLIADKNYELKSARIDGTDCVFIGKYKDDLYYSTDGISAERMKDDQKLVLTYAEIKETQDEEDSSDQTPDEEAPEQISVQSLDEELERSVETGNETSTDRVEYVDADGNSIAGAPATIDFGPIKDHSKLSIDGKHLEFKSATVNGKNCVYIGKYRETIYYSMDGVVAIKLEHDQKLRMTYQEYYNITIREIAPENGPLGTITQKNGDIDVPFDITKDVRVNAGKDWTISITPGPADNKKRYKIKDVTSQSGATITRHAGDDYGAIYNISFRKDDTITITYDALGVYRVTINTRSNDGTEYINIPHSEKNGYGLDESGNLTWTYTEDDVDSDGSIKLPVFHTKKNYRLIHMVLNKQTVSAADSPREVPSGTGTNDAVKGHAGELIVNASMEDVPRGEREECQYEYSIKVQRQSGGWQDLNFDLAPYAIKEQALTVRMITDGRRSDEGLDVVMWDPVNKKLIPMHDNDTVNMDAIGSDTLLTQQTRQGRIFFAKPKSGYSFTNGGVNVGQPHSEDSPTTDGAVSIAQYGSISEMNANTMDKPRPFEIYQKTWSDAKEAAKSSGYTMYLSYGGAKAKNPPWILYAAYFSVASDSIYVHYNSGAGAGVLPEGADVKNIPYNSEIHERTGKPMQSYGANPDTEQGKRSMGSTFLLGEGCPEPTCEGYEFIGWKLRKKDFWQQQESFSDKLYKHNEVFKISEDNYDFAQNQDLPVSVWNSEKGYQVVAQWKKIGMKNVKVEHYLKVPNADHPILKKTTDGTIVFADDQNQVIASGKPEPDGIFPGYVFDENDSRNKLEVIKNDSSTETITLKVYYKPTELMVSKAVTGYNLEPDRNYTFTIQANASMGTETGALVIENEQIYIKKKNENTVRNLAFTDNKATFTLKKGEIVQIFCLSTGWNYTISETDPGSNYKTTYHQINKGTVKEGRDASFDLTDASASVQFINVSTISPPETGRILQNNGYKILLMVVLAAGFVCMVFFKKMKRNIRS